MSKRAVRKLNGARIVATAEDVTVAAAEGESGRPTFRMVLYAGGPFQPHGWDKPHPLVMDLAGMVVAQGNGKAIPFNRKHSGDDALVGHGTPTIAANEIRVEDGVFSFDNAHTSEIIEASKNGFPWAASLEARLTAVPEFVAAGKSVSVNERTIAGPVYVARKSELFAGAFIGSNPADRTTSVSIAATEHSMPTALKEWLEAKGIECESLTEDQIAAWSKDYDAIQAAGKEAKAEPEAEPVENVAVEIRAAAASETKRIGGIRKAFGGRFPEVEASCIEKGLSIEAAGKELRIAELEEDASNAPTGPAIHAHSSEDLQDSTVMAAGLYQRMRPEEKHTQFVADAFGEKQAELSERLPKFAGLKYLLYQQVKAASPHTDPLTLSPNELIKAAFRADAEVRRQQDIFGASGFSTVALSDVLSNLAHKMLLREYRLFDSVVERVCETVTHTDFKEHTRVRVDGDVEALELGSSGEIKHGELNDSKYTSKLITLARMLAVTRTDFINDDLGAFSRNGQALGRGQMKAREKLMFITLLDSALVGANDYFKTSADSASSTGQDAGVINRVTGQGAPTAAMLQTAEQLMDEMEDEDGTPIIISPAFILTGTKSRHEFSNLLEKRTVHAIDDNIAAGSERRELRIADEYLGRFGLAATPWMNSRTSVPGSSDTLHFLIADKNDVVAMEYLTLQGAPSPTIESADTDFNTLGVQMRTFWDIGFAMRDPRGMVRIEE